MQRNGAVPAFGFIYGLYFAQMKKYQSVTHVQKDCKYYVVFILKKRKKNIRHVV